MILGVWAHPTREFPEGQDSVTDVRAWLGKLRDAGISVYLPFVSSSSGHVFDSPVLGKPQRDLLGPIVEQAAELDMEVHPIVGLGGVTPGFSDSQGFYVPMQREDEEMPSWSAHWVDPAWDENVEHIVDIGTGILEDYDCDGLHMDAVRYPNSAALNDHPCVCERCCEARQQWLGKPVPDAEDLANPAVSYLEVEMRNRFVSALAWDLTSECRTRGLYISLAARARYLKDAVVEGQDWSAWCRQGILDFVCPMSYNPCFDRFQRFVDEHLRLLEGTEVDYYPGVGRKSSLGTLSPADMIQQLQFVRDQGIEGACIFHAAALEDEDLRLLGEFSRESG